MSFFKKLGELFQAPPPRDAHTDWFYYTKIFTKKLVLIYRNLISIVDKQSILKVADTINPPELSFNISVEEVLKLWGKPRCRFNNNKPDSNIQVLFYRRNIVYESTLLQLQFYNNNLFFVCMEVGKSMMPEETKMNMLLNMLPNYITANFKTVDAIPIMEDANHNFLLIQDDVLLNVCFLNGQFVGDDFHLLEEAKKYVSEAKSIDD